MADLDLVASSSWSDTRSKCFAQSRPPFQGRGQRRHAKGGAPRSRFTGGQSGTRQQARQAKLGTASKAALASVLKAMEQAVAAVPICPEPEAELSAAAARRESAADILLKVTDGALLAVVQVVAELPGLPDEVTILVLRSCLTLVDAAAQACAAASHAACAEHGDAQEVVAAAHRELTSPAVLADSVARYMASTVLERLDVLEAFRHG